MEERERTSAILRKRKQCPSSSGQQEGSPESERGVFVKLPYRELINLFAGTEKRSRLSPADNDTNSYESKIDAEWQPEECYSWAVTQGHPDALFQLSQLCRILLGDDKKTVTFLRLAAQKGQVDAQIEMGIRFREGKGVEKDDAKAFKYEIVSAEKGHHLAFQSLGLRYVHGNGTERDEKKGVEFMRWAAEKGNSVAMYNLGLMYHDGRCVEQDLKKAVEWYRLGAQGGNTVARTNLGVLYLQGRGVAQDRKQAMEHFQIAADGGYVDALFNIGSAYLRGGSLAVDFARAVSYYQLASALGDEESEQRFKALTGRDSSSRRRTKDN